jgi:hypothetical protein
MAAGTASDSFPANPMLELVAVPLPVTLIVIWLVNVYG